MSKIEPIRADQEHFRVPTLRTDARGIALGDRGVIRFSILPHVVQFFQALSEEQSLDHMAASLRVIKVKSRTTGLEFIVDIPTQGSYQMDRAAAIARVVGGQVYTGTWPHFVPYRDRKSPLGYDTNALASFDDGGIFYGVARPQMLSLSGEMTFSNLLMHLALVRREADEESRCILKVEPGLRPRVESFLRRRQVHAGVARVHQIVDERTKRAKEFFVFEVAKMVEHLFHLFSEMPGVEVFHSRGHNVFVERGFAHQFALENCRRFFSDDEVYFFSGTRGSVDRIEGGKLTFVDISTLDVTRVKTLDAVQTQKVGLAPPHGAKLQGVDLGDATDYRVRLVRIKSPQSEHVTGAWLSKPQEIFWLKKIVYTLPQAALEGYRLAMTDQGALVTHDDGIEWIPIGLSLKQHFPAVFLPTGTTLVPPLSYAHLVDGLGLEKGYVYVVPEKLERPIAIAREFLQPMVKHLLADIQPVRPSSSAAPSPPDLSGGIPLQSGDASVFALWAENFFPTQIAKTTKALADGQDKKSTGSDEGVA